jgi:hypothetical protein
MFKKLITNIATKSAIRIVLTLLVGIFIGVKFPEGTKVVCTIAEVLQTDIDLCENATLQ